MAGTNEYSGGGEKKEVLHWRGRQRGLDANQPQDLHRLERKSTKARRGLKISHALDPLTSVLSVGSRAACVLLH